MGSFRSAGLDEAQLRHYFGLTDQELRLQDVRRGFAPASSPYRAPGPIYVRKGATRAIPPPGLVHDHVLRRVMSLRVYDAGGMMLPPGRSDGRG